MIATVYGLGHVGSTLASLLLKFDDVSILNLMDPSPSIAGRVLDVEHAGNWSRVEVRLNDHSLVCRSDFIFFAAGHSNPVGASRYEVAQLNKTLILEVFTGLKVKDRATIIAITNPVDQAAFWISECLPHCNQVLGTGTLLDTFRLQSILGKVTGVPGHRVKAMVLGEHGEHMIPIFSEARIVASGKEKLPPDLDTAGITRQLRGMAGQIRQTEEATKYGVAHCAVGIMEAILEERETMVPVSIRINAHYKQRFGVERDLFMSLPCLVENERMVIVDKLSFSDEELAGLCTAAASIAANL